VRAKDKGTFAESHLVNYLVGSGIFPGAHRSALAGTNDIGDIIGCRDYTIQVKNCKTMQIPAWLRDTEDQRLRHGEPFGILVIKRIGSGVTTIGNWHVVMLNEPWKLLWREAGKPPVNMWFTGKSASQALGWQNLGLDSIRCEFRQGITVAGDTQYRVMTVDGWLNLARRRIGMPEHISLEENLARRGEQPIDHYINNPLHPFLRGAAA
jgi:hypothetical protein